MPFCRKCGQNNDSSARFCQSCGGELFPVGVHSQIVMYAGFWQRFAAFVIDWLIVSVACGLLIVGTLGSANIALIALPWVYEALMTSSEKQATLGKMVLGIMVVDLQGQRISFARATGRHFAKYLSGFILFIGFIMAAFSQKKQALHDMIADTLVVNK